jgi:CheY-like chemotaxis protein
MTEGLKRSREKIERQGKELKEHARELEMQKAEAERANKAKSIFLANISHEIRTPLTSILGNAELLLPHILDEKKKEHIENIKASTRTLKEFIDNTLYMSKIEPQMIEYTPKPVNIYSILIDIRGNFSYPINRKNLKYLEDIGPDIPQFLELDRVRLKQVLINLLSNAIKNTDKGHIKLFLRKEKNSTDKDKRSVDLKIEVEDTGCGISAEEQRRLTELFESPGDQNKQHYEGTGLGLPISKSIVQLMGGKISLKSQPGKGSTFSVLLKDVKIASSDSVAFNTEDFDYSTVEFGKRTILVVDDEEKTREIVAGYLEGTKLQVLEAENGEKALKLLERNKPDLVIMDLSLPGIDGVEVTKRIRKDQSLVDIPIFAFTASITYQDEIEKIRDLFDRYLLKPISKARLFFELALFLEEKKPVTERDEGINCVERILKFDLNFENPKVLFEVIDQLDSYWELWEIASRNNNFKKFKEFGQKVKEVGHKYSMTNLADFGRYIVSYVDNYNIQALKAIVESYPTLINKLKNLQEMGTEHPKV